MRILSFSIAAVAMAFFPPARADDASIREQSTRYEIAFQAMSVADLALTMDCLHRDVCREGNPIYGRNPSDRELIFGKLAFGLAHWLIFQEIRERDPKLARGFAGISAIVQGGIVAANLRFAF